MITFRAYQLLEEAADMNHTSAMDKVAIAYLFGDHVSQNVSRALELFNKLAAMGYPQGQRVKVSVI